MIVFVVVQEMECPNGGGADAVAVYGSKKGADDCVKQLVSELGDFGSSRKYKYPTSWFVRELELEYELDYHD